MASGSRLQGTLKTVNPAPPVPDDDPSPPADGASSAATARIETHLTVPADTVPADRNRSTGPRSTIAPSEHAAEVTIEPAQGGEPLTVAVVAASADRLRGLAESLLVANGVDDDRYQPPAPGGGIGTDSVTVGAALIVGDHVVATVSGSPSRGRLQLDVMGRWPEWPEDRSDPVPSRVDAAAALVGQCLTLSEHAPGSDRWRPEIWAKPVQPWHLELARRLAMTSHRALHQLRCPLPVVPPTPPLATRDLDPVHDLEPMLAVNNRAFASHPDQGGRDRVYLERAFADPGFDPADVRIAVDGESGRMIGFCWTKIHPPGPNRSETAGEIYVIGIDPDFQSRGHGISLTAAGLDHLHQQGATLGMLYVEADNEPALATYRKLGFTVHRTDRAWRHD